MTYMVIGKFGESYDVLAVCQSRQDAEDQIESALMCGDSIVQAQEYQIVEII